MFITRIEILKKSEVKDEYNEKTAFYERVMLCDAERTMSGGRENVYASRIVNTNEVAYSIRWREGITPSMFVRERGKIMGIKSVNEEGNRYRIHIVTCLTDFEDD